MPIINLPTAAVNYSDQGKGQALVLLHANPGDSQDYAAIMPALIQQYRVIALDWPGYGASPSLNQPEIANGVIFAKLLKEFLDELELKQILLIGNSLGGNAAIRLSVEHPELIKGLVLVSPGGFTPHNPFTRLFCRLQASPLALPPTLFARMYLRVRSSTTAELLSRAAKQQSSPQRKRLSRYLWRSFGEPVNDLRPIAGAIEAPTLLIFGAYDPVVIALTDARVARRIMPQAEFVMLKCGHVAFAELPELFLDTVQPFLAKCVAKSEGSNSA